MRIRHKPHARPELAAWPHHIDEPRQQRGGWRQLFANPALPLHLELGCGKGGFLSRKALADPFCNHLGVEIKSEMLLVAKHKTEALFAEAGRPMGNLLFTRWNIEQIGEIFGTNDTVERIFVNFCNPWYKSGHAKHRLTHPRQLVQYRHFLQPEGELWFKTDDVALFNDTLRYLSLAGFAVVWQTRDLHAEEPDWNIRTEHEQMFAEQGLPILACAARMQPAQLDESALSRMKTI